MITDTAMKSSLKSRRWIEMRSEQIKFSAPPSALHLSAIAPTLHAEPQ